MKRIVLVFSLLFLSSLWYNSSACTVVVAGMKATADGSVLNSHTDCGPDNRVRIIPGQKFKKGAMAPVFWGLLE
ncbi:MAG: peptidase, partial [Candidatus Riflebacteria bacterium]|nr:peptidase [Candidatus Riflebacteria bacterium]